MQVLPKPSNSLSDPIKLDIHIRNKLKDIKILLPLVYG